jgi:hypothetical protein
MLWKWLRALFPECFFDLCDNLMREADIFPILKMRTIESQWDYGSVQVGLASWKKYFYLSWDHQSSLPKDDTFSVLKQYCVVCTAKNNMVSSFYVCEL